MGTRFSLLVQILREAGDEVEFDMDVVSWGEPLGPKSKENM